MGRLSFSANLGFLWAGRPLPQAIRAAHAAGFDAVECHWPYEAPPAEIIAALEDTGLQMLGLNTIRGNPGDNGLAALPDRIPEARAAIDQALDYAAAINARNIHVMAGIAEGPAAKDTFLANLDYAATRAAADSRVILIEPLNQHDAPGYFLNTTDQGVAILDTLAKDNVKLMFDCYHVGRTEGDVINRLENVLPHIGHIQFAAVPDRGPPDTGTLNYTKVFAAIEALVWSKPLGAEYKTGGDTEATLSWMSEMSGIANQNHSAP